MQYRTLGKTGLQVSALGFGLMRLPQMERDGRKIIDEAGASSMLQRAVAGGINLIDTAWPYHDGESEGFLGRWLSRSGNRDSLILQTKLPIWLVQQYSDMDRFLDAQLERLGVSTIDIYLAHALNGGDWPRISELGLTRFLEQARQDGRIRHAGFSFHDHSRAFRTILQEWDWEVTLLQHNYVDQEFQAGRQGVEEAIKRGLGVILMEPLRGGKLAGPLPKDVQAVFDQSPRQRTPVEWAFHYVWDIPGVSSVLSGMSNAPQLRENLVLAADARCGSLTEAERQTLLQAGAEFRRKMPWPCTDCGYCTPCPQGVAISTCINLYNTAVAFDDLETRKMVYQHLVPEAAHASRCNVCSHCIPRCPQGIDIPEALAVVAEKFDDTTPGRQ